MLEVRFRNGNRDFYPYGLLGPCRYNPSVGLLLRFTGDVVTLVLIRGSNLDALVHQGAVSLRGRGDRAGGVDRVRGAIRTRCTSTTLHLINKRSLIEWRHGWRKP